MASCCLGAIRPVPCVGVGDCKTTSIAWLRAVPDSDRPARTVSVTARPQRKPLVPVHWFGQWMDGVGVQARRFVARQGFQFVADFQRIAFDESDVVAHRDIHLPLFLAARWGGGEYAHRARARSYVNPSTRGQQTHQGQQAQT